MQMSLFVLDADVSNLQPGFRERLRARTEAQPRRSGASRPAAHHHPGSGNKKGKAPTSSAIGVVRIKI